MRIVFDTESLIKYLPKFLRLRFYKKSCFKDINGRQIREGSIIKAKWCGDSYYGGLPGEKNNTIHCVEYYEGQFGSDIHSDFELISMYKDIIVLGHVEDYRKEYEKRSTILHGNFGACIKG